MKIKRMKNQKVIHILLLLFLIVVYLYINSGVSRGDLPGYKPRYNKMTHSARMYGIIRDCSKEGVEDYLNKHPKEVNEMDPHFLDFPIHWASIKGDPEILKLLIKRGAKINVSDFDGETPLHMACAEGNTDVIRILLKNGAEVNAFNHRGETPLIKAVGTGNLDTVKPLVEAGADVNHKDYKNRTPISIAGFQENREIAEYLISKGAKSDYGQILRFIKRKDPDMLIFLAVHSPDFFIKVIIPLLIPILLIIIVLIRNRYKPKDI